MPKNSSRYSIDDQATATRAPVYAGLAGCADLANHPDDRLEIAASAATLLFPRLVLAHFKARIAMLRGSRLGRRVIERCAARLSLAPATAPDDITGLVEIFRGFRPHPIDRYDSLATTLALLYFLSGEGCDAAVEFQTDDSGRATGARLILNTGREPAEIMTPHR
ncbi:hypothetical protein FJU08_15370 [Martelella alba]|uniref:Uncharacterized protein n=1 Tax=Martelella alba TaxID=2590451 RepID=A0A506U6U9_9HYPH|nr:hypothetical protein [Martelella alba]TPW29228.1 hypothetical protein FJU08_15370 [Martelella alba]